MCVLSEFVSSERQVLRQDYTFWIYLGKVSIREKGMESEDHHTGLTPMKEKEGLCRKNLRL